jgi:hypothetical protein
MPTDRVIPIEIAARALGISVRQVERDIAAGAPVVRRGGRGRGNATLINLQAFADWRRSGPDYRVRALAVELPEIIASAMYEAFVATHGPHKLSCAGVLSRAGYLASVAVVDRLRRDIPDLRELSGVPEKCDTLRRIFELSGKVRPVSPRG